MQTTIRSNLNLLRHSSSSAIRTIRIGNVGNRNNIPLLHTTSRYRRFDNGAVLYLRGKFVSFL
jgi:hypothetical protein